MKTNRTVLSVLLLTAGTAALAQQPMTQAQKDSTAQAEMIRLDKNSAQAPRRDTMKVGEYSYREKTQIIRKDGKDSVVVTERSSAYRPDPNAVSMKPGPPVSTPVGYDALSQRRQEIIDRIDIAIKDLDEEIGMISNLRSTGTKSPSQNWKTRSQRLKNYKSKLNNIASTVKSGNARELNRAEGQAMSTIREARAALTSGNRRM